MKPYNSTHEKQRKDKTHPAHREDGVGPDHGSDSTDRYQGELDYRGVTKKKKTPDSESAGD